MMLKIILGILIILLTFGSGMAIGLGLQSSSVVYVESPVYYLDSARIQQYLDHIHYLGELNEEYQIDREEYAKELMRVKEERAILGVKVAFYESRSSVILEVERQ